MGTVDAFDERVGDDFPRLIVASKAFEKFGLAGIVFHKLRGQFHKVPIDIGAAQSLVVGTGKDAVQGVTKLVKEGFEFVKGE